MKENERYTESQAIKAWLYRITKNTVIDYYKKKKELSVSPELLLYIEEETVDEDNMNEEIARYMERLLFDLPEKYQEVYNLYENKDMKHKEISEQLDI